MKTSPPDLSHIHISWVRQNPHLHFTISFDGSISEQVSDSSMTTTNQWWRRFKTCQEAWAQLVTHSHGHYGLIALNHWVHERTDSGFGQTAQRTEIKYEREPNRQENLRNHQMRDASDHHRDHKTWNRSRHRTINQEGCQRDQNWVHHMSQGPHHTWSYKMHHRVDERAQRWSLRWFPSTCLVSIHQNVGGDIRKWNDAILWESGVREYAQFAETPGQGCQNY